MHVRSHAMRMPHAEAERAEDEIEEFLAVEAPTVEHDATHAGMR